MDVAGTARRRLLGLCANTPGVPNAHFARLLRVRPRISVPIPAACLLPEVHKRRGTIRRASEASFRENWHTLAPRHRARPAQELCRSLLGTEALFRPSRPDRSRGCVFAAREAFARMQNNPH